MSKISPGVLAPPHEVLTPEEWRSRGREQRRLTARSKRPPKLLVVHGNSYRNRQARSTRIMANRHFGKISDVWKHATLAEVLEREPPARYAETHAGSGAYAVVHDRERKYGILRFLQVAAPPIMIVLTVMLVSFARRQPTAPNRRQAHRKHARYDRPTSALSSMPPPH